MGSLIHQHSHEEDVAAAHSVINFKTGAAHGYHSCTSTFMQSTSTSTSTSNNSGVSNLLSFEQNKHEGDGDGDGDEGYPMWEENLMMSPHALVKSSSLDDHFFHKETYQQMMNHEDQDRDSPFGAWLYASQPALDHHCIQQSAAESSSVLHKRPHLGESLQGSKKQCSSNGAIIKNKQKPNKSVTAVVSKDPQSIAAKNRRERISERLKILQELVPNGSKVDLVTMLEKAISYVKFLQLQVKVLATDEFWPVQGGKAPDISQVKEAIDAILQSSQRERNSTSSSKS